MKYTPEKVLYFANQAKGLHVAVDEPERSDLMGHFRHYISLNLIEQVAEDDSGRYFKTTLAGEKRLLELQIEWRTKRGKCIEQHQRRLTEIKEIYEKEQNL